tara:strand:- start:987 stop:1967 length:981 start_codon:yes stop_codon:yes gene_type:complete
VKHGSLFSGIGGIDLGFEMAGIETAWTCEIDDWCNELLQKRFPNATHYRDVQKIGKDNLEPVDIISGGFPCQDISTAGKGAGLDGKRSGLWFEMWRIICELRPRWVFIENVANLANKGGERVLHDLAEAGYDAEWQVISARDVGGRHLRKRIWIIAYRKEISDTLCKRFQGQLHSSKGEDRNQVRGKWTDKSSIQTRNPEISDTLCRELEGHNRNIKRKNRNTTRRRDNSKSVVQRRDIEPFNTQTTSKRGTTKDIERQDNRDGKFRIKTFEILKNEPELDRVAYGLSQKVDRYNDRIKGLGNAVVPQIPYQLGKRIKELNNLLGE